MCDLDRGGGGDAVHGYGPVGGGRGEDVGLSGTRCDRVDGPSPRAFGADPHGREVGRAGRPRPGPDALIDGATEQDSGAGEEADGINAVGVALKCGVHAAEGGVLRRVSEALSARGDGVRTSGFHSAIQRPAPNARRPHGDQSAAAGCRLAPTAMSGQDTAAIRAVREMFDAGRTAVGA